MRANLYLLVFIYLLAACEKTAAPQANIIGQWRWTKDVVGNPTIAVNPSTTGINEVVVFELGGSYRITRNGVTTNQGSFVVTKPAQSDKDNAWQISFSNARVADSIQHFAIEGNELQMGYWLPGIVGAGTRYFERD